MTTNNTANYIASRNVSKWIPRAEAATIWNDLKLDGWRAEGLTLVKLVDETYHHFQFAKHGNRVSVSHHVMEVAS